MRCAGSNSLDADRGLRTEDAFLVQTKYKKPGLQALADESNVVLLYF